MMRPVLFFTRTRRFLQGLDPGWIVSGKCEPDPITTMRGALRYSRLEGLKFRNGRMKPWRPTHVITHPRRRIPVTMVENALYVEDEWIPCTIAEWEYDDRNVRLLFQGFIMATTWELILFADINRFSLFSPRHVPVSESFISQPMMLGVRFLSSDPGRVLGIRFFQHPNEGAWTDVWLWRVADQALLVHKGTTVEIGRGWRQVMFDQPISITPDEHYIAAYNAYSAYYYDSLALSQSWRNGPLSGMNGVYVQPHWVFPTFVTTTSFTADLIFESSVDIAKMSSPLMGSYLPEVGFGLNENEE
jgi:hypothetical protein